MKFVRDRRRWVEWLFEGAFWEDRYRATAVERDEHLALCKEVELPAQRYLGTELRSADYADYTEMKDLRTYKIIGAAIEHKRLVYGF